MYVIARKVVLLPRRTVLNYLFADISRLWVCLSKLCYNLFERVNRFPDAVMVGLDSGKPEDTKVVDGKVDHHGHSTGLWPFAGN